MHPVDTFCLVKAFLGHLFLATQQTVEKKKAYGESQKSRQDDEFDCVVVAIGDLVTVPEPRVIDSILEHFLKEVLMR